MFVFDQKFSYVDLKVGPRKASKWKRVQSQEVQDIKGQDVLCTIQAWDQAEYQEGQLQLTPLYWDFDHEDPDVARKDCLTLINHLTEVFELNKPEEVIDVHFSGKKGFHVILDHRVTDTQAKPDCTKVVKRAALYFRDLLNLESVDEKVYSVRRLFRVPNTIHSESGLHCIKLFHNELMQEMDYIKNLAKQPRDEEVYSHPTTVEASAKDYWRKHIKEHDKLVTLGQIRPLKPIGKVEEYPVCMKHLLETGLAVHGTRNDALVQLVSFFKEQGMSKEDARERLIDWSLTKTGRYSKASDAEKVAEVKCNVEWGYGKNTETYTLCSKIQSIGMPCDGPKCKVVSDGDQDQISVIKCSINDAISADLTGKRIQVVGNVQTKSNEIFSIPRQVTYSCKPNPKSNVCPSCWRGNSGKIDQSIVLDASKDSLLELISTAKDRENPLFKKLFKIPGKCPGANFNPTGYVNLTGLTITPTTPSDGIASYSELDAYYIGEPSDIDETESYIFTGVSHSDPKTHRVIFLIDEVQAVAQTFTSWKPSESIIKRLKKFQPDSWSEEDITKKLKHIALDSSETVHHIHNREMYDILCDLVWHSALHIKMPSKGNRELRGWLELLVVGDSGNGKSELLKARQRHTSTGVRITAETLTRTGILGGTVKGARDKFELVWGIGPQNDGKLLILEEVHDDSQNAKDAFKKLTNARSDGVAQITMAKKGERKMRVRMIWVGNPPFCNTTGQYNFPVQMATELFKELEDIRRFDGMCVLRNEDITSADSSKSVKQRNPFYTAADCHDRVMFAWSRSSDQIKWDEGVMDLINELAEKMLKDYHYSVPIVSVGDMPVKLARWAVSCAMLTMSTDDGVNVIVRKGHVKAIYKILNENYKSESMGYYDYSKLQYRKDQFEDGEFKTICDVLIGENLTLYDERVRIANYLASNSMFNRGQLENACAINETRAKYIFDCLGKYNLIEKRSKWDWRLTKRGRTVIEFLRNDKTESLVEKSVSKYIGDLDG